MVTEREKSWPINRKLQQSTSMGVILSNNIDNSVRRW